MMRSLAGVFATLLLVCIMAGCHGPNLVETPSSSDGQVGACRGKIRSIEQQNQTLSLAVPGKGVMVLMYSDDTRLSHAPSYNDLHVDEFLDVEYVTLGAEKVATRIAKVVAPLPEGSLPLTLADLRLLVEGGGLDDARVMLIDSRPAPRYNEGHIPGAVSIPLAELERADRAGKVHPRLPAEKDTRLIFYCGGITCPLSPRSAAIVIKQGFTSVRVFHDGEPAWTKAELPLQASARFIKDGNAVLLDIRPPDRFAAGHLERALNIPFRHIGSRFGKEFFPGYKPAPIVIIGDSQEELLTTFERLRDWGYSRVVTFPADPGRWQREGLALVTGFQPPPPKLDYVRILGPFEVSIPDFHQALANSNSLIIDTRSSTEYYVGHLPGALNIPSGEGEDSYGDIPREPPVYLYCATGARAEMLFAILRAQGYLNVRVLKATVEFEGDGYRIRE